MDNDKLTAGKAPQPLQHRRAPQSEAQTAFPEACGPCLRSVIVRPRNRRTALTSSFMERTADLKIEEPRYQLGQSNVQEFSEWAPLIIAVRPFSAEPRQQR